ncbi:MAG TPA: hypothetical protein VGY53_12210, partial [Isosphaeraceae bacterium]|nr:hypothetical protein [Isosphaeraceae bacterium]
MSCATIPPTTQSGLVRKVHAARFRQCIGAVISAFLFLQSTQATAAGPTFDKAVEDLVAAEESLADTLATVVDAPSGNKAAPAVRAAMFRIDRASGRFKGVAKPSPEEDEKVRRQYEKRLVAAEKRLGAEISRVKELAATQPSLRTVVRDIFAFRLGRSPWSATAGGGAAGATAGAAGEAPAPKAAAPKATTASSSPAPAAPSLSRPRPNAAARGNVAQDPSRLLKFTINGVADDDTAARLVAKVKALVGSKADTSPSIETQRRGPVLDILVGPVETSPEALAAKIRFAKVTRVNGRTIELMATSAFGSAEDPPAHQTGQPPASWSVSLEPAPQVVEFPAGKPIRIMLPQGVGNDDVLFPTSQSPFLVLGKNGFNGAPHTLVDLRTAKAVGSIRVALQFSDPWALSPDGEFITAKVENGKQGVWSFKTGKEVRLIDLGSPFFDFVDFAGPDLLIAGRVGERQFQIWNFPSGQMVRQMALVGKPDREAIALSPGRRYLAAVCPDDNTLQVYDLNTGGQVGLFRVSKFGPFNIKCIGLAFSDDGQELAGIFESFGNIRILDWDFATGQLLADHYFDKNSGLKRPLGDRGQAIEWLPDRAGWLVFGYAILERKSGERIWSLPSAGPGPAPGQHRVLDLERVLMVSGQGPGQALTTVALPKDKVGATLKAVSSGGSLVDTILSPATAADWSSAQRLSISKETPPWDVAADPAPKSPARLARPIALNSPFGDVESVLFSAPDSPRVFVCFGPRGGNFFKSGATSEGTTRWVDSYDLSNGQKLSRVELPSVSEPIAASPDGAQLLLRTIKNPERLDLLSVNDRRNLVGWRPYESDSGDARAVAWADFLDADRVLTLSGGGTLVLWKLPECKATYAVDEAGALPAGLSPGRKVLAVFSGTAVRFFDPQTGALRGNSAPVPSRGDRWITPPKALAFAQDGQQLAVALDERLVVWELAKGQVTSDISVPGERSSVEWCGARRVLVDNRALFDLDRKFEVWSYRAGLAAAGSPDGRHWFVTGTFEKDPAFLAAVSLPEPALDAVLTKYDDPRFPALIRPGGRISIDLEIEGAPQDPVALRKSILDHFSASAQRAGVMVADGQPVRIVVSLKEVQGTVMLQLRSFGGPNRETTSFPQHNIEYEAYLVDQAGRIPLGIKQVFIPK